MAVLYCMCDSTALLVMYVLLVLAVLYCVCGWSLDSLHNMPGIGLTKNFCRVKWAAGSTWLLLAVPYCTLGFGDTEPAGELLA